MVLGMFASGGACGSPSGSPGGSPGPGATATGTVSGTLLGKSFTPADAASFTSAGGVVVVLDDAAGVCGDLASNAVHAGSSSLVMMLPAATSGATYPAVEVQFAEFDATCNSPAGESGSGSVTITSAGSSSISGTFSFSLDADSVTGSFVAPTCAATADGGSSVCR